MKKLVLFLFILLLATPLLAQDRTRRIIVVSAAVAEQANTRIAQSDIHGQHGEFTFTVPLWRLSRDPSIHPPDAYWCNWLLPDAWWTKIAQWAQNQGLDNGVDFAQYPADDFTPEQVLADTTRKPVALKVDDTVEP